MRNEMQYGNQIDMEHLLTVPIGTEKDKNAEFMAVQ